MAQSQAQNSPEKWKAVFVRFFVFGSLLVTSHPLCHSCCQFQAEELGPRTNKGGPCLVLLTNVRVSPEEFLAWFQTSWFKT